jgi:hypothetical protein
METAATAMDNKSQEFVDKILGQEGDLNLEKSKIMISSCSNYLRNQPGYVVWSTDTPPIKNDDKNRISFEQLSQNRVDAQYEVLTALVQRKFSEKQKILEDEIKKIQANRALLPGSASQSEIAKILEGEISKLQLQVDKIAKIDVKKIKSVSVPCDIGDNKGVAGPNPYFNQLKQKYRDYPAWPNPNSMSKSVYHIEVAKLSKDLKTMDVQDKLALTQKALEGVEDSDAGKIVKANYEDMIKKYKKILAKTDGSPAYLDIPLFNDYGRLYPCEPSKPGDNIKCDLVTANSKALDGFKIEKMLVDVQMDKIEIQPDRKKPIPDEIPPFIEPGKGKIFHVAAICARKAKKVDQPKKKKESYDYYNTINKPSKASKQ